MSHHYRSSFCLAVAALLAACGGSAKTSPTTVAAPITTTSTATTTPATTPAALSVTPVIGKQTVTGSSGKLDPAVTAAVESALSAYVQAATLDPLAGRAVVLTSALSPTLTKLTDAERAAFTDEGAPVVTANPSATLTVDLAGLSGPDKAVGAVVATIDLTVGGTTAGAATIQIHRHGTVVLVNDNGWKIDSFNLNVDRTLP